MEAMSEPMRGLLEMLLRLARGNGEGEATPMTMKRGLGLKGNSGEEKAKEAKL